MTTTSVTTHAKLVTIVAASELWDRLEAGLRALGAKGYTFAAVSGWGQHGPRAGGILHSGNVRVEAIVTDEVADAILKHLAATYSNFELTAYIHEVEALVRPAGTNLRR